MAEKKDVSCSGRIDVDGEAVFCDKPYGHDGPCFPVPETTVVLTPAEINLLIEALDSHNYWQLGEDSERDNGFVIPHRDAEGLDTGECPEDCDRTEAHQEIRDCEELADRLRTYIK